MKILRYIAFPFSFLYGIILVIRNWFFRVGIYRTEKVPVKVISVGNLSIGGTGKSPHVLFLAEELHKNHQIAILSRGYGRKTKGFVLADENSQHDDIGDEALNYFKQLSKNVKVAVCEKRVDGAKKLLELFPEIEIIILDDAYQHRYLYRDCNILLTEFQRPYFNDFVLPTGRLREFSIGKSRADITLVTKSPENLEETEKSNFKSKLKAVNSNIYFSKIKYGNLKSLHDNQIIPIPKNIILVTGIGNPTPLLEQLSLHSKVDLIKFNDHHDYTSEDIAKIHEIFLNFVGSDKAIVTTEKDAMRLLNKKTLPLLEDYPWYYQEMTVELDNKEHFFKNVYGYINKNQ